MKNQLLVIGAGPKALALAAKAHVLTELGWEAPEILVVEKEAVGAHWSGAFGYTDGTQELGTPPDKDCGFPYSSQFGVDVDESMLRLSWTAHAIERRFFSDWVDRGRPQPRHKQWADYLEWVAQRIGLKPILGEVSKIETRPDRWQVRVQCADERTRTVEGIGLVITGPGSPKSLDGQPKGNPRVFDGKTFWQNVEKFEGLSEGDIGIIGSGETAASVVVALLQRVSKEVAIHIMNEQGAVFSRGESYDENRIFSDPNEWKFLSEEHRREIIKRTDRGVFSQHSKRIIDRAENVRHKIARIERVSSHGRLRRPVVHGKYQGEARNTVLDYLIVATGFEPLWFVPLMSEGLRKRFSSPKEVECGIETDLSLRDQFPKIHLPMLAAFQQGPGFPNLSSLGLLSDRILRPYVKVKGAPSIEKTR